MKRIYTYILMMVCAMMFAGCQKDWDGILTAEIENYRGGDNKVYINTEKFACWHDGDKVWLNGNECSVGISGNTATIQNVKEAAMYTAYYPFDRVSVSGELILPQTQIYREQAMPNGQGNVQVIDAPMMAYAAQDGTTLGFRNVGSVLAVKVDQVANGKERRVRRIEVSDSNGHMLWGEATCSWENGAPKLGTLNNGGSKVALNIPYDLGMVNGERTFYVALPPVENAKLKVKVIFEGKFDRQIEGGWTESYTLYYKIEKYSQSANSIARNKYIPLPITVGNISEGDFNVLEGEGTAANPYLIESEVHLWALATNYDRCYIRNKYFKQTADVVVDRPDMYEGISGNYGRGQANFSGVYDGGGKTITLGSVDHPSESGIFYAVKSNENARTVIKNLNAQVVIAGNMSNTSDQCKVGGMANIIWGSADILNCKVMGSVKGASSGGIVGYVSSYSGGAINIENCTNMAEVNVGGIVGSINGSSDALPSINIKNCVNEGKIDAGSIGGGNTDLGIGGIIGVFPLGGGNLSIEDCTNKGDVMSNQNNIPVGGIFGRHSGIGSNYFSLKIINCCNLGHINNKNAWGYLANAGGIVGYLEDYNGNCHIIEIDRCINRGVIEGRSYAGGVCGSYDNYYNHPLYISISNSMNWGSVYSYENVGGLIGYGSFVEIKNSCNMGDVKWDKHRDDGSEGFGNISGLIGTVSTKGNVVLDNVYVGGTIRRQKSRGSQEYDILKDCYLVGTILTPITGTPEITLTSTNVYIPEGGKSSIYDNSLIDDTSVKRYDANRNVVGMSPAKSLVDVLNGNRVTLPEGISKESWVETRNRVMLLYGLLTEPSMPLPGTGNQNEQYGDMGNDVWE